LSAALKNTILSGFFPKTDILSGAEERATRYNWGRALCGAENPAEKNSGIFAAVQ